MKQREEKNMERRNRKIRRKREQRGRKKIKIKKHIDADRKYINT